MGMDTRRMERLMAMAIPDMCTCVRESLCDLQRTVTPCPVVEVSAGQGRGNPGYVRGPGTRGWVTRDRP